MERTPFSRSFFQQGERHVAICVQLEVATCATSLAKAFAALDEAVGLCIKTLAENGELDAVLPERELRHPGGPV